MNATGGRWLSSMILVVLLALTACQATQTAFVRTVNNAGAAFAAAATTLSYLHEGKLLTSYARSSFENYRSELDGLEQQLPAQQGKPADGTVQQLLAVYAPAMRAIDAPCLEASCNWQGQVAAMQHASQEFLKAGGQG